MEEIDEPIDAVYLWVDGSATGFRESLTNALLKSPAPFGHASFERCRFRNNGELRYSLRSLGKYAPWIRYIYIVTNGQMPEWLNRENERIRLITHSELFADCRNLPTFNSHAIELQLHRIPGLSRRFLYFNDDLFLGRPCARDTFIVNRSLQRIYFQETPLPDNPHNGPVHDRAYAYTQNLMAQQWPRRAERLLPAHVPQLYDKDVIAQLEKRFAAAFQQTARNRFRTPKDLVLRILYAFYQLENAPSHSGHESIVLVQPSPQYMFIRLQQADRATIWALEMAKHLRPRFFCINDEVADLDAGHLGLSRTRQLLVQMYPQVSSFECNAPSSAILFQRELWNQRLRDHWSPEGVGSLAYGREWNRWCYRIRRKQFRKLVGKLEIDLANARILDIGCGTGFYLREWIKSGAKHITGMDISDVAIYRLREELPSVELVHWNACELPGPLAGRHFDVVSAFDILFHIINDDDYEQLLRGINELLRTGGYLIFSENFLRGATRHHENYWRSRSQNIIQEIVLRTGFEVISLNPLFVVMGAPVDTQAKWPAHIWNRVMKSVHTFHMGGLLGRLLYPLENVLLRQVRRGPSTKVMVCRK